MSETTDTNQQQDMPDAIEAKPHTPSGKVAAIREAKPDLAGMGEALKDMEPATAKARKEAASYRQRLRDAEAERDSLKQLLTGLRRNVLASRPEFRRLVAGAAPDVIAGLDDDQLAALFTDDGTADAEAIGAVVDQALAEKPYLKAGKVYDHTAVRTSQLAENPQGAVGKKGDPLRNALRR